MLKAIGNNTINNTLKFTGKSSDKKQDNIDETHLLPSNAKTRINQGTQKTMSAFIDYPVKGLKGDVNSNFYEFLTMGIVPYLLGSAMFMVVFNALNLGKHLGANDAKAAGIKGKKMALGVVLYGLMKSISKNLVNKPIKMATGVDTEMPYQNKVYNLPKEAGEDAEILVQWQQRKVFDSKEFFRKDLLDREYFDKVAKKLGLGENLNDSISETTPIIQNVVATANTAKTLSSYCWAATGVALATQDSWVEFFNAVSKKEKPVLKDKALSSNFINRFKTFGKNTFKLSIEFIKSLGKSVRDLWSGNKSTGGFMKHAGKALLGISSLITILLTSNSIIKAKNMAKNSNIKTIDDEKESVVI